MIARPLSPRVEIAKPSPVIGDKTVTLRVLEPSGNQGRSRDSGARLILSVSPA